MTTAISVEDVRREVNILKALSGHKHMIKFQDAFEDANNVYIVMERAFYNLKVKYSFVVRLCEGGELIDRILSRCGVVHRDLKPENFIFTTRDEDAPMKIIDFGLSDFIRPDQGLNDVVGSVYYVAPAVLHRSYSVEADMWKLILTFMIHPAFCIIRSQRFCEKASEQGSPEKNDCCPRFRQAFNNMIARGYSLAFLLMFCWLQALSKALPDDAHVNLMTQFRLLEPKDGCVSLSNFKAMKPLYYKKMDFEEFCAATISVYQLEAFEELESIARKAFEYFEQEGNKAISVKELALELNLGPSAHSFLRD
ncbi:Detected protein of unknown function [Hibiscus syriacus]|uniref:non-specific serine/threonine protein kinase n=1 Tax=Hibiscus syriacus TaxID=106335 RepID=A0A6A2XJ55_HIBSY|nr:Detected protein of unknown function [Hibiscus syriacus]